MSLNRAERTKTRDEIAANLALSGSTPERIGEALGWDLSRTSASLAVAGASPSDVQLLRDYLEKVIIQAGEIPHPYSLLTEDRRAAADAWFGLASDVSITGTTAR